MWGMAEAADRIEFLEKFRTGPISSFWVLGTEDKWPRCDT